MLDSLISVLHEVTQSALLNSFSPTGSCLKLSLWYYFIIYNFSQVTNNVEVMLNCLFWFHWYWNHVFYFSMTWNVSYDSYQMVYEYCVNLSIDLAMKSIISPPTPHPYFQVTLGVQNNNTTIGFTTLYVFWGCFKKSDIFQFYSKILKNGISTWY